MKYFPFVLCFIISSCGNQPVSMESSLPKIIDHHPGSCPYFTKDLKGNILLSWIREVNDSSFIFCYAVSKDNGKSFGEPISIPSSTNVHPHAENIPKIICKPSGEIIAVWGASHPNSKNPYGGFIFYAQSFDGGGTWNGARKLVSETAGSDQRYFDLALKPDGEAAIIWLDNRKTWQTDGSALFISTTSGRDGFRQEKRIGGPCCECCRTVLTVTDNNHVHVLYREILQDSIRDMVHAVSTDGGMHFSKPKKISNDRWVIRGCPHAGPSMSATNDMLQLAWFTGSHPAGIYYTVSHNNGNSFAPRKTLSLSGRHPQISNFRGKDAVITWDEPIHSGDSIFNQVVIKYVNAHSEEMISQAVSPDSTVSKYPVLLATGASTVMLAYDQVLRGRSFITYQRLRFR